MSRSWIILVCLVLALLAVALFYYERRSAPATAATAVLPNSTNPEVQLRASDVLFHTEKAALPNSTNPEVQRLYLDIQQLQRKRQALRAERRLLSAQLDTTRQRIERLKKSRP